MTGKAIIPEVLPPEEKQPGTGLDVFEPLDFDEWRQAQKAAQENMDIFLASMEAKIHGAGTRESTEKLLRVLHLRQVKEMLVPLGKWTQWCASQGIKPRHADFEISKLGKWSDTLLTKFVSYAGLPFNKIPYLTNCDPTGHLQKLEVVQDGEQIYIDGKAVPLNKDEVQKAIQILEDQKQDALDKAEKAKADMEDSNKTAKKATRDLEKLKGLAKENSRTVEEEGFFQQMTAIKKDFDELIARMKPEYSKKLADTSLSEGAALEYRGTITYIKERIIALEKGGGEDYALEHM